MVRRLGSAVGLSACLLGAIASGAVGEDCNEACCAPTSDMRSCGDTPNGCPYTGSRIALVLGNNEYRDKKDKALPTLQNAVSDAEEVRRTLRQSGFSVNCVKNATRVEAEAELDLVREYRDKLNDEVEKKILGPSDVQLVFYFAGHGLRSKGGNQNLIIYRYRGGEQVDGTILGQISHRIEPMVNKYLSAANVQPVVLIDACRAPAIAATMPGDHMLGVKNYALYYSTPLGRDAPDVGPSRFTSLMVREMQLRGLSINSMFTKVAVKVKKQWDLVPDADLDFTNRWLSDYWLQPEQPCDTDAATIWNAIRKPCSEGVEDDCAPTFDPTKVPRICKIWGEWTKSPICGDNPLTQVFKKYFERGPRKLCDEPQISSIADPRPVRFASGESYTPLAFKRDAAAFEELFVARRIAPEVAFVDLEALAPGRLRSQQIMAMFKTAEFSKPRLAQDQLEVFAPVALHTLPTARTQDALGVTLALGTKVLRDCETLQCQPGWIGVQYKDPKESKTYRGFLPKSAVALTVPQEIKLDYAAKGLVPDAGSLKRLQTHVQQYPMAERGKIRPQVSGRYLNAPDTSETYVRAMARADGLSEMLRAAGFQPAITDVYEAADGSIPAAVVELPAR